MQCLLNTRAIEIGRPLQETLLVDQDRGDIARTLTVREFGNERGDDDEVCLDCFLLVD